MADPQSPPFDARALLTRLEHEIDRVYNHIRDLPVTPNVTVPGLRARVEQAFDFEAPRDAADVFDTAAELLRDASLHVSHPRYFGLFNPTAIPSTIFADALVALVNPQAGGWSHGPATNEMERRVLLHLATQLGFPADQTSAHFTSGGNEANHTAVIAALASRFPAWRTGGLRVLNGAPTLYVSNEAHHSFVKVARATGLGTDAVRHVAVDQHLRMDPAALADTIARDRAAGLLPFLVVATTGTTGAGAIDPAAAIGDVARAHDLWFHVDAAWGGSAALIPRLKPLFNGIADADSLTWDAHKWLSVPLGAGMFFTRRAEVLEQAFGVDTGYIPRTEAGAVDLYKTTMQWSRRFIGLKLLFALAEYGRDGIVAMVDHQARMGDHLRQRLHETGWLVVNDTPLPLICFTHPSLTRDRSAIDAFVAAIHARGRVWISSVHLPEHGWVLRACITSFRVNEEDLDVLIQELETVRTARL